MSTVQRQLIVFDFDWLVAIKNISHNAQNTIQVHGRPGQRQVDLRSPGARRPSKDGESQR